MARPARHEQLRKAPAHATRRARTEASNRAPSVHKATAALMSKVLVATHELVQRSMAGPGIRAYEISRQLHRAGHDVRLAVPGNTDLNAQPFEIVTYDLERVDDLRRAGTGQDVAFVSCFVLPHSPILRQLIPCLAIDLNDPFHLEHLAAKAADPQSR